MFKDEEYEEKDYVEVELFPAQPQSYKPYDPADSWNFLHDDPLSGIPAYGPILGSQPSIVYCSTGPIYHFDTTTNYSSSYTPILTVPVTYSAETTSRPYFVDSTSYDWDSRDDAITTIDLRPVRTGW